MNIIDQVVSWFSPQRGFARQAWRDALRHYDAGDDSRLNANWRAINTSAEQTDRYSRDTVRARARDLERNSDMLNGVMGAFVRNVVGGGFIPSLPGMRTRMRNANLIVMLAELTGDLFCLDILCSLCYNECAI